MTPPFHLLGSEVTVFGGSGFLGRHLVKRLAAAGAVVRVAVRRPEAASFLKPLGDVGQIVPLAADIRSDEAVRVAVEGAAAVVNLVGILYERGRSTFEAIHHQGAARVAAAARAAGARKLVHVSALGADKASAALYARTKAMGEEAVRAAFPSATIVRPSVVFGPEDRFFNLFAALARISPVLPVFGCRPRLVAQAGKLPRLDLFGAGGPRMQPVYAGDVAEAMTRALEAAAAEGRTYELGGPRVYSFKELMELVLLETGRRRILVPVPFALAMAAAAVFDLVRLPIITRDQVRLLRRDNVVSAGAPTFADLGIAPTAAEIILPTYLARFRPRGAAR